MNEIWILGLTIPVAAPVPVGSKAKNMSSWLHLLPGFVTTKRKLIGYKIQCNFKTDWNCLSWNLSHLGPRLSGDALLFLVLFRDPRIFWAILDRFFFPLSLLWHQASLPCATWFQGTRCGTWRVGGGMSAWGIKKAHSSSVSIQSGLTLKAYLEISEKIYMSL